MPEYTLAAVAALGVASLAALAVGLHRRRSTWLTVLVFGACTVVFDLLLTGLPIVTYDDAYRSGVGIGPMPIEDLLYGLALCLTALSAWTWADRRARARATP
jgi:lycopene cyclase domain-containing protein